MEKKRGGEKNLNCGTVKWKIINTNEKRCLNFEKQKIM